MNVWTRITRPSFINYDHNIEVAKNSGHLNKRENLSVSESEYEMAASKRETNSESNSKC